jgi:hypothetical protein
MTAPKEHAINWQICRFRTSQNKGATENTQGSRSSFNLNGGEAEFLSYEEVDPSKRQKVTIMTRKSQIAILTSLVLLLSACGNEGQQLQADSDPDQNSPARASATSERVMGYVRWYDRESVFSRVECSDRSGDLDGWHYSARNNEVGLRAWRNPNEPEHASTARTTIGLWINREDDPNLRFHMLDNMSHDSGLLIGDVEADSEGISGQTLVVAANTPTGYEYPWPEGIEIEFELNCP